MSSIAGDGEAEEEVEPEHLAVDGLSSSPKKTCPHNVDQDRLSAGEDEGTKGARETFFFVFMLQERPKWVQVCSQAFKGQLPSKAKSLQSNIDFRP